MPSNDSEVLGDATPMPVAWGWRNVLLIESYLAWTLAVIWMVRPPTGYSEALIYAIAYLCAMVGGIVVAAIVGRAANKIADKWQPGQFGGSSTAVTQNTTPSVSSTPATTGGKP